MPSSGNFATASLGLLTALANYGARTPRSEADHAVAAALDKIPGARERAGAIAKRALAVRRRPAAVDETALRAAITAAAGSRLPMLAPGLRMPAISDNFQSDPNDKSRPPFRFSVPAANGAKREVVFTQETLRARRAAALARPTAAVAVGDPLTSADARKALAREYAQWGFADEALALNAINSHVSTLSAQASQTLYRIEYMGMYCQKETDWDQGSDSDEPYFIFGSNVPASGQNWTALTNVAGAGSDGIDSGDNWGADPSPQYVAGQNGGVIARSPFVCVIQAMEHDEGDPNAYHDEVQTAVAAASAYAKSYGITIPDFIQNLLTNFLTGVLGTGDDQLGVGSFSLDGPGLEWWSQQPLTTWSPGEGKGSNSYHFPVLCEGAGTKYWTFFRVLKA
jgi:hypothetical protein